MEAFKIFGWVLVVYYIIVALLVLFTTAVFGRGCSKDEEKKMSWGKIWWITLGWPFVWGPHHGFVMLKNYFTSGR